jgi:hypothetical protein
MASFPTFRVSGTCLANTIILKRIKGKSGYDLGITRTYHQSGDLSNQDRKIKLLRQNNKKKCCNRANINVLNMQIDAYMPKYEMVIEKW